LSSPLLLAKGAAIVLTDENARKAVGWVMIAILSPVILVIAFLCALASGTAPHNISAAELCFYSGELPSDTPKEYRTYIEDMRTSFELLDGFIAAANHKTEGEESLDGIKVKAFFMPSTSRRTPPAAGTARSSWTASPPTKSEPAWSL